MGCAQVPASLLSCFQLLCDWLLSPAAVTNLIRKVLICLFTKSFSCSSASFPTSRCLPTDFSTLPDEAAAQTSCCIEDRTRWGFGGSHRCSLSKVHCLIFGSLGSLGAGCTARDQWEPCWRSRLPGGSVAFTRLVDILGEQGQRCCSADLTPACVLVQLHCG